MKEYVVLSEDSVETLERKVNDMAQHGYVVKFLSEPGGTDGLITVVMEHDREEP